MAGDNPLPPKPSTPIEKPFGITNIKTCIPLVLDLNEMNYDSWSELFILHCMSFGVLNFIHITSMSAKRDANELEKLDSLVKLWIFGATSKSLLQRVLKKSTTFHDVWKQRIYVFHDNKSVRAMQLDNDLRHIELGNLLIIDYFHRIRHMADLLANIDSPVDEKNLIFYAINGLSENRMGYASECTLGHGNKGRNMWSAYSNAEPNGSRGILGLVPPTGPCAAFGPTRMQGLADPPGFNWTPQTGYGSYMDQTTSLP
ncbi:hypothetical protein Tco_1117159 [Tanacetum coccineum]